MNYDELGTFAIQAGDYQEAINIYRRALQYDKTTSRYIGFGLAHLNLEDYLTARWAFYKALDIDPKNADILKHIQKVENILTPSVHETFRLFWFDIASGGDNEEVVGEDLAVRR